MGQKIKIVMVLFLIFSLGFSVRGNNKTIIIGIEKNIAPIEFYNESGEPCGMNVDIIRNLFSPNEYTIKWIPVDAHNYNNIIRFMLKYKNAQKNFYFSKFPVLNFYETIVVKEDTYYINKLENLNGHTIAIEKNCPAVEILRNEAPYAVLVKVNSIDEGFTLLKNNKVVAFIGNEYSILYTMGKNKLKDLKIIGEPIYLGGMYITVPKTAKKLKDYIDKKLSKFLKSDKYKKIINKWLGEDLYKTRKMNKIFRYLFIIIGILLGFIVIFIFWNKSLKREVKKKLEKVNKLENRYYNLIQNAPIGVITIDEEYNIVTVNKAVAKIIESDMEKINSAGNIFMLSFFQRGNEARIRKCIETIVATKEARTDIFNFVKEKGKKVTLKIIGFLSDFIGGGFYVTLFLLDITELEKAKEELIYTSKMDAVGRFTGGITHDFNNIMTGILSLVEFIKETKKLPDDLLEDIESIENFANRAVNLTKKLLGFSKKQEFTPVKANLNHLVEKDLNFIMRIIKENIKLKKHLEPNLYNCKIDPVQFEQILLNLTHNSVDAMNKDGGKIIIETKNIQVDKNNIEEFFPLEKGKYVMISFSDTGAGIPDKIKNQIFDPFFSTKKQGTGFGLSIVYNIVKLNRGIIRVYSEINKGTIFKIYFPAVDDGNNKSNQNLNKSGKTNNDLQNIVVLVVEDNEEIKDLIHRNLKLNNITVFSFASGIEAIKFVKKNRDIRIDLLITDLILKDTNGNQLSFELRKIIRELKVLYMSGYTQNVIVEYGIAPEDANFIQKPFTIESLLDKIRVMF